LDNHDTRACVIRWIIFYDCGINGSSHDIVDENVIIRQLVVAMIRDMHFSPGHELTNSL